MCGKHLEMMWYVVSMQEKSLTFQEEDWSYSVEKQETPSTTELFFSI